MTSFIYVGEQAYSICLRCTRNSDLWIVAELLPGSDMTGFMCEQCLTELATLAGFIIGDEHKAKVAQYEQIIREQEAQIETIPNLLEGLTSNVNTIIANFVTDLAGVTVSNIFVQSEDNQADSGSVAAKPRGASKSNSSAKVAAPAVDEPTGE